MIYGITSSVLVIFCSQAHPLLSHSGFEHCFCYGDVLLSFVWVNEDNPNNRRKLSATTENVVKEEFLRSQHSKHDFIRTQFHRTTHCDFCSKKVHPPVLVIKTVLNELCC